MVYDVISGVSPLVKHTFLIPYSNIHPIQSSQGLELQNPLEETRTTYNVPPCILADRL